MTFKSGFVTIIGRPNVGKSTLLNKLLKEKISIVTPKPQTTRHQIKGIYTDAEKQIIFTDTPGFLKPRYELQHRMLDYIKISLKDSDCLLFMTDITTFPTDYDLSIIEILKKVKIPCIALLNKVDRIEQTQTRNILESWSYPFFDKVIPLSAIHLQKVDDFLSMIATYLPYNPPYYAEDEISDLPMRFFVQELIREQIFLQFQQEVPYSSTVVVEQFIEKDNKIEIAANIWLERRSQKIILIGKNGEKIKQLRNQSEKAIHAILGKRIKLELWVKIKQNWRKKKNSLKEFGYR